MCREEAMELSSRSQQLTRNYGMHMVAICHEEEGVQEFATKYFQGGKVYVDEDKKFYSALGGGHLPVLGLLNGLFRPSVWKNITRANSKNMAGNLKGEGRILGGLLVVGKGNRGVVYQYNEKVYGDHAPIEEVLKACQVASSPTNTNTTARV